jgi:tetratricopeptide (TPR) repeat protein
MQSATLSSPSSRVETEVKRIAALLGRREFVQALAAAQSLRTQVPGNRDVLYLLAVSYRSLRRIAEALATLGDLEKSQPRFGRLFQERGHCHAALNAVVPAIDAYVRAVNLNPNLPESWQALHALLRQTGHDAESEAAAAQAARLATLPAQLLTAFEMHGNGDVGGAEELVRDYLASHGEHVEGLRLLAKIAMDADASYDAELLLARAKDLAPENTVVRYEYALVLVNRQRHERARIELDRLLAVDPRDHSFRALNAAVCAGLGDYDRAVPLYRELLAQTPLEPELHVSLAHALKTCGLQREAIGQYREATALRADFGEAYWSLANLKTYRFAPAELASMQRAEAQPSVRPTDRYHLCFALGKALEDMERYAESFAYYARGNALKQIEVRYKPQVLEQAARVQAELCTGEFFEARKNHGCSSTAPIFILGLPRSGSTLIEQILASHSQVDGTMELAEIPRLAQNLRSSALAGPGPGYPQGIAQLNAEICLKLGEQYVRDTRVYRTGRPYFIDKMPNNFRHIGLIRLILPNARIIDARREPMACCFSIFKQLFAAGQRFAYDLVHIARYYRMYLELMSHWDAALPGAVLRVRHEDLVSDLEPNVRRILDYCGLAFEPACLDFHRTRRSVHSASSEQVRQALDAQGIDHWRHYEAWLDPLKAALGDALTG